jgi:kynurenine formamidase
MSKKKEKVIVTKKSTKKWDLEHYGLSDVCIVFFKFKTEKSKMDIYFCPFSKNPKYF